MSSGRVFVIAEVGVNHNGDPELARKMIGVASDAGADAVKFQSFRADALVVQDAPKAQYQKETTGAAESQYEMLRKLELTPEDHGLLARECRARGVEFLSTPFDETAADLLERLGVARYKIASGEVTNLILLRHVAAKKKPVILSTGMSTLEEIGAAVEVLRSGGVGDLQLLHCVSDYPTRPVDVNLKVMETLRKQFGLPVGLSDHTVGIAVAIGAVALGATILEKHVTLDKNLPGPDHRASLEPAELRAMVQGIREVQSALGDPEKRLTAGEQATRQVARRSLVAAVDLAAGTVLERKHLAAKRPATGVSPMDLDRVIGRRLKRAKDRDARFLWDDLE